METIFIVLGIILLFQSLVAFGAALRLSLYARRKHPLRQNRYQPKAIVIVPCKGLDPDFEENIRLLFSQDYRDYEIIFVVEDESDPAYTVTSRLIKQNRRAAWMVVAGEAEGRGQKVHNLRAAIEMLNAIDRRAEVLVFVDSDARPSRHWLADLVAPLADKRVGATTGFRWYLPDRTTGWQRGRFVSLLLSVWNASALTLLGERSSFAWGGSMAIRRENFEKLDIKRRWQGSVSDDYVLTAAIQEARQSIRFVPQCLVASYADVSFKDLLEFTTRQIRITRVYKPRVWRLTCFTQGLYNFTLWGGLLWLASERIKGELNQVLALLLLVIISLGALTGSIRGAVASHLLIANRENVTTSWWTYALFGPAISLIYLYNVIASMWTTRITWRGIGYDLVSPNETVIRHRPAQRSPSDSTSRSLPRRKASVRSSSPK